MHVDHYPPDAFSDERVKVYGIRAEPPLGIVNELPAIAINVLQAVLDNEQMAFNKREIC